MRLQYCSTIRMSMRALTYLRACLKDIPCGIYRWRSATLRTPKIQHARFLISFPCHCATLWYPFLGMKNPGDGSNVFQTSSKACSCPCFLRQAWIQFLLCLNTRRKTIESMSSVGRSGSETRWNSCKMFWPKLIPRPHNMAWALSNFDPGNQFSYSCFSSSQLA